MATFTATVESEADISAQRDEVWKALTDPALLARLTPLLDHIEVDGDLWRWHMIKIAALGVSIVPAFTERMTFDEGRRIDYTHEPPGGRKERAGAEGVYELSDAGGAGGGTHLSIRLQLSVELPLPRGSAGAVERVMRGQMNRTGEKFSANLLEHLGAHEL